MRRMTTAAVAAATALSLATVPATAETGSSNEDGANGGGIKMTSSYESILKGSAGSSAEERESLDQFLKSSKDNDLKNGYDLGTTFDILLGTGIAALLLVLAGGAAAQFGGFKLPF